MKRPATTASPQEGGRRPDHSGTFVWADSADADFASTAADQFLIQASGGVGIGTNAPAAGLHVEGADYPDTFMILNATSATGDAGLRLNREEDVRWHLYNNGNADTLNIRNGSFTAVLIATQSGDVGVGTTSPSFKLEVNGTAGKPGGGSWSNSSDRRLKKNINGLEGALEALLALRGVTYEYRNPKVINELPGERIGMIAQEVEQVFPDWVERGGHGYKTLTFRGFEALTVEALRELRAEKDAEIEALRREKDAEIAALRARLERLETLLID